METPLSNEFLHDLKKRTLHLQIVVAMLVMACVVFMAIATVMNWSQKVEPGEEESGLFLTYMALASVPIALIARYVVPEIQVRSACRQIGAGAWRLAPPGKPIDGTTERWIERHGDPARLFFVFMTRTIIAGAFLEGAAFFSIVTYLIEDSPIALVVAIGLTLFLAIHFPTIGRVRGWIEDQLRLIESERTLSDAR